MDMSSGRPRVVIADDHALLREAARHVLEVAGIAVVGDAADGYQTLALTTRLAPDVLVLDLAMQRPSGIEVIDALAERAPAVRVLVLTASADPDDVAAAIAHGAYGYLTKDAHPDALPCAVRLAFTGQLALPRDSARMLLRAARAHIGASERMSRSERTARAACALLSAREQRILSLLASGAPNGSIGRTLAISEHTVKQHVTRIFEKLEVCNRVQAAVVAERARIVR